MKSQLSGFVRKQGEYLLGNKWHALVHAMALALLPYTAWLSVAIIALVTLRKGWREGGWLIIPVMIAHVALSLTSLNAAIGLINTLLTFMPCYLAACALRSTISWRAVSCVFFMQAGLILVMVQLWFPDFVAAQYLYIQSAINEMQSDSVVMSFINDKTGVNQVILAGYFLGLQAVGVIFSATLSLMLARSVQSKLFNPGGFRQEMLMFRGDKIGFLLLAIVTIAAYQQSILAISMLPMLVLYFLIAGLSLSFNVLAKKRPLSSGVFILSTLILLPFIMLPVYVIFGSLDSLFNFRLYLSSDAGKTI